MLHFRHKRFSPRQFKIDCQKNPPSVGIKSTEFHLNRGATFLYLVRKWKDGYINPVTDTYYSSPTICKHYSRIFTAIYEHVHDKGSGNHQVYMFQLSYICYNHENEAVKSSFGTNREGNWNYLWVFWRSLLQEVKGSSSFEKNTCIPMAWQKYRIDLQLVSVCNCRVANTCWYFQYYAWYAHIHAHVD